MNLYKYERMEYEDPDKSDNNSNEEKPNGPGKITQAMEMMKNGDI
jgi:3-methyladenine DNA glycosylase Mpg